MEGNLEKKLLKSVILSWVKDLIYPQWQTSNKN